MQRDNGTLQRPRGPVHHSQLRPGPGSRAATPAGRSDIRTEKTVPAGWGRSDYSFGRYASHTGTQARTRAAAPLRTQGLPQFRTQGAHCSVWMGPASLCLPSKTYYCGCELGRGRPGAGG